MLASTSNVVPLFIPGQVTPISVTLARFGAALDALPYDPQGSAERSPHSGNPPYLPIDADITFSYLDALLAHVAHAASYGITASLVLIGDMQWTQGPAAATVQHVAQKAAYMLLESLNTLHSTRSSNAQPLQRNSEGVDPSGQPQMMTSATANTTTSSYVFAECFNYDLASEKRIASVPSLEATKQLSISGWDDVIQLQRILPYSLSMTSHGCAQIVTLTTRRADTLPHGRIQLCVVPSFESADWVLHRHLRRDARLAPSEILQCNALTSVVLHCGSASCASIRTGPHIEELIKTLQCIKKQVCAPVQNTPAAEFLLNARYTKVSEQLKLRELQRAASEAEAPRQGVHQQQQQQLTAAEEKIKILEEELILTRASFSRIRTRYAQITNYIQRLFEENPSLKDLLAHWNAQRRLSLLEDGDEEEEEDYVGEGEETDEAVDDDHHSIPSRTRGNHPTQHAVQRKQNNNKVVVRDVLVSPAISLEPTERTTQQGLVRMPPETANGPNPDSILTDILKSMTVQHERLSALESRFEFGSLQCPVPQQPSLAEQNERHHEEILLLRGAVAWRQESAECMLRVLQEALPTQRNVLDARRGESTFHNQAGSHAPNSESTSALYSMLKVYDARVGELEAQLAAMLDVDLDAQMGEYYVTEIARLERDCVAWMTKYRLQCGSQHT